MTLKLINDLCIVMTFKTIITVQFRLYFTSPPSFTAFASII